MRLSQRGEPSRLLGFMCFAFSAGLALPVNAELSLANAIQQAVAQHPEISAARFQVERSMAERRSYQATWLPQVSMEIQQPIEGDQQDPFAVLQVTQRFIDFGGYEFSIKERDALTDQARFTVREREESIAQRASLAFLNVLLAEQRVLAGADYVQSLRSISARLQDRVGAGVAVRSELLLVEMRVGAAESEHLRLQADVRRARNELREWLGGGHVPATLMLPTTDIEQVIAQLTATTEWSEHQVTHTPAYAAAAAAGQAARSGTERVRRAALPTLSIQGSYRLDGNDRPPGIAMVVSGNLYAGGSSRAQYAAAQAEVMSKDDELRAIALSLEARFRNTLETLATTSHQLHLLDAQLQRAEQARELYFSEYLISGRSLLDVMSAENEYYSAVLNVLGLRDERWRAALEYLAATGQLVEFAQRP